MSHTVLERGVVRPVQLTDMQMLAEAIRLGAHPDEYDGYDTPQELLVSETSEYLEIAQLGLCRLEDFTTQPAEYLCEIGKRADDSYAFTVIYYNGGGGLSEVLENDWLGGLEVTR